MRARHRRTRCVCGHQVERRHANWLRERVWRDERSPPSAQPTPLSAIGRVDDDRNWRFLLRVTVASSTARVAITLIPEKKTRVAASLVVRDSLSLEPRVSRVLNSCGRRVVSTLAQCRHGVDPEGASLESSRGEGVTPVFSSFRIAPRESKIIRVLSFRSKNLQGAFPRQRCAMRRSYNAQRVVEERRECSRA